MSQVSRNVFLLIITCFALLWCQGLTVRGQDEPNGTPKYQGITRCLDCHYAPNPLRSTAFVLMNEGKVWLENDKHAIAYQQLGSAWGKRVAAKLGIVDAQADQSCLSCHANWQVGFDEPPQSYRHGVHCETCHGPSSLWEVPHADVTWRQQDPQSKQKLGMHDLRSPSVSSRLCFSCHLGDRETGKLVTHAMYAAGHPPLSSIEVGSFMRQMPGHWRSIQEKPNFKHRAEYKHVNSNIDGENDQLPSTKAVIVSGVVAVQESVRLMASQLERIETGRIEFAVFDCSACHHELRTTSWRQVRGRLGIRPGRPLPTIWPGTLMQVALKQASGEDEQLFQRLQGEYKELQRELLTAATSRPFGDTEKLRGSADRMLPWLDQMVRTLESNAIHRQQGQRILRSMLQVGQVDLLDYHSARMLSWAIITTSLEMKTPYTLLGDDLSGAAFSDWLRDVKQPALAHVNSKWKEAGLFSDLSLELPLRPNKSIESDMALRSAAALRYDAIDFRSRIRRIAKQFETSESNGVGALR